MLVGPISSHAGIPFHGFNAGILSMLASAWLKFPGVWSDVAVRTTPGASASVQLKEKQALFFLAVLQRSVPCPHLSLQLLASSRRYDGL